MFKHLQDLLVNNENNITKSKDNLDNLFIKIKNSLDSSNKLLENVDQFSKETSNYKSLCLLHIELVNISCKEITWRDVLEFKRLVGFFNDALKEARHLNYPFFIWNGLIYSSSLEGMYAIGEISDLNQGK